MTCSIVYIDGQLVPETEAKVSVYDRGFLFGDGVYEVLPVYQGEPFRLEQHLQRLESSLEAIQIGSPYDREQWQQAMLSLIQANGGGNLSLYLQVTRGRQPQRQHTWSEGQLPTVVMFCQPMAEDAPLTGVKAVTLEDIRWRRCDIKSISLLGAVLLKQEAENQGASEALLHRGGWLTEGSASNLFIVRDGEILTPPKDALILNGITRDLVFELARRCQLPIREERFNLERLYQADEIWITSSTREISPVLDLDGKVVGDGSIGPISRQLNQAFQQFKAELKQEVS